MIKSSKTFILSDETQNMFGWKLITDGLDTEDFLLNPVMLYNHDYTKLIGQWTDVRKEDGKLLGVPMFDENDEEAMKYYDKVEQGILKAASVGITPVEFDEINGVMVCSCLKEASLTPVGANRKAVTVYDHNGKRLSANEVTGFCLSLQPVSEKQIKNMNEKFIAALIALSAQAGLTINLSATSKDEEAIDVIKKVGEKITTLTNKQTELSGKIKTMEDASKAAEVNEHKELLKKAVDDKLLSAEKAEELKTLELPMLKVVLSAMKPVEVKTIESPKNKEGEGEQNDEKAKWTYDEYALNAPDELEKMQITDNARFEKLLTAKVEKARKDYSINL